MKYKKLVADITHCRWEYLKKYDKPHKDHLYYYLPITRLPGIYGPVYMVTKDWPLIGNSSKKINEVTQRFTFQPIDTPTDMESLWVTNQLLDEDYKSRLLGINLMLSLNRGFNAFLQKIDPSMEMRFIDVAFDKKVFTDYDAPFDYLKSLHAISYVKDFNPDLYLHPYTKIFFHKDKVIDSQYRKSAYLGVPLSDTECVYMISVGEYEFLRMIQKITVRINAHEVELPCNNNPQEVLTNCFYLSRYSQAQEWCIPTLNSYNIRITFESVNSIQEVELRGIFDDVSEPISFYNLIMSIYHSMDGEKNAQLL